MIDFNMRETFKEALKKIAAPTLQRTELKIRVGKLLFKAPAADNAIYLSSGDLFSPRSLDYLNEKGLRPYFTPNLKPELWSEIETKLENLGFEKVEYENNCSVSVHFAEVGAHRFNMSVFVKQTLEGSSENGQRPEIANPDK